MLMAYMDPEWWPGKEIPCIHRVKPSDRTISSIIATFSSLTNAFRTEAMRRILSRSHFQRLTPSQERRRRPSSSSRTCDTSLHQVAAIMITQAINGLLRIQAGHLDIPIQVWMDDCRAMSFPDSPDKMSATGQRNRIQCSCASPDIRLSSGYGHDEAETIIQWVAIPYFYLGGEDYDSTRKDLGRRRPSSVRDPCNGQGIHVPHPAGTAPAQDKKDAPVKREDSESNRSALGVGRGRRDRNTKNRRGWLPSPCFQNLCIYAHVLSTEPAGDRHLVAVLRV